MKRLILLRHAEAIPATDVMDDIMRPLSEYGKVQAQKLAFEFAKFNVKPDFVAVSHAERTKQTAALIAKTIAAQARIQFYSELYLAELETLWEFINHFDDGFDNLMIIAHNPGLQDLVYQVAMHKSYEDFMLKGLPTAGLALLHGDNVKSWRDFSVNNISKADFII